MGKFIIKSVPSGVKFDLAAGNGEVIATSEPYSSMAAVHKGIRSVIAIAPDAHLSDLTSEITEKIPNPKFEVYKDKSGQYRFRLRARNGKSVVFSEAYTTKSACLGGIESVRKNAVNSETVEK